MNYAIVSTAKHCTKSNITNQWLSEYLQSCDMAEVGVELADVVIIATCGVVKEQIDKAASITKQALASVRPEAKIIFTGCVLPSVLGLPNDKYTYLRPSSIVEIKEVLGLAKCLSLDEYSGYLSNSNKNSPIKSGGTNVVVEQALAAKSGFAICVARGCLGNCTYCNVKTSIGELKSYPMDTIIKLFRKSVTHDTALITADDLGCWGQDIGSNIVKLLWALSEVDTSAKMYLQELNPQWIIKFREDILKFLSKNSSKILMISVPIQSGCNTTLTRMKRNYDLNEVMSIVDEIRLVAPTVKILSTILVGFPGETDIDFQISIDYFKRLRADAVWVSPYSDMESLPCYEYEGKVAEATINKRVIHTMHYVEGAYR